MISIGEQRYLGRVVSTISWLIMLKKVIAGLLMAYLREITVISGIWTV
jgi:hypothetical protein